MNFQPESDIELPEWMTGVVSPFHIPPHLARYINTLEFMKAGGKGGVVVRWGSRMIQNVVWSWTLKNRPVLNLFL